MTEKRIPPYQSIFYLAGNFFLSNFFFLLLFGWTGFLFTISISTFHFPIAVAASIAYGFYFNSTLKEKLSFPTFITSILFCLLFIAVSIFISDFYYDISWDGTEYHQTAIIELKNGWNPIKNPFTGINSNDLIVFSYAKASWIAEASIYSFTSTIQSAKALHFMMMAASGFLAAGFLVELKKFNRLTIALLSLTLVFNPITVSQFFTFYLDGILFLGMVYLFILFIRLFKDGIKTQLLLEVLFCIHIISTLKFTGIVYACILSFFFLLAYLLQANFKKAVRLSILFLIMHLSVLFTSGYNPYCTNTLTNKHPFYPLNVLVIPSCGQMPENFCEANRVYTFAYSLFSRTSNAESPAPADLKFPFTYKSWEVTSYPIADARTAGFGLWFSGALLLSIYLLYETFKNSILKFKSPHFWILFIIAGLTVSVLINPHPWWARYVPQFYLFPFIAFVASMLVSVENKRIKYQRTVLIITLLVNSYLTLEGTLRINNPKSMAIREELESLKKSKKIVYLTCNRPSVEARLTDQKIKVFQIDSKMLVGKDTDTLSHLLSVQKGVFYLE